MNCADPEDRVVITSDMLWWCNPKNDPLALEVAYMLPRFGPSMDATILGSEVACGYEQLWAVREGLAEEI